MNSYERTYNILIESWTRKKFTRYQQGIKQTKTPEGKESRKKAHQGAEKGNRSERRRREEVQQDLLLTPEDRERAAAGIGNSPEAQYVRKRRNNPIITGGRIDVGKGKPGLVNKFKITRKMLGGDD